MVRVHRGVAGAPEASRDAADAKDIWKERFKSIRAFERHLARNGTLVLKFFLHVSKEEQRKRLLDRLEEPAKRWKFSMGDVAERKLWDKYMAAYEDMIRQPAARMRPGTWCRPTTSGSRACWSRGRLVEALERLDLEFPRIEGAALKELQTVRKALLAERR